jgi:hypothetical protein
MRVQSFLKRPQILNVGTKGVRGLTVRPVVMLPVFEVAWTEPEAKSDPVPLRPGEEVTAKVTLENIPADANFTRIGAALEPQSTAQSKEDPKTLVEQQSTVSEDGGQARTYNVIVNAPTSPSNLTVRLGDGEVFWTFPNALTEGRHDLPDLAQEVNAFLDRVQEETGEISLPLELPFRIQSSSTGEAAVVINSISYSRLKTQSWENELDNTTRVDRNLELDFATVREIPLDPLASTADQPIVLRNIALDLGGALGPERLLGTVERHDGREFATISSDFSLAQAFVLSGPIQCAGVSGLMVNEAVAEVYIEIQCDDVGKSFSAPPQAQVNLLLSPPEPGAGLNWSLARFDTPVGLQADVTYWLIIKGVRGRVRLALQEQVDTYLTDTLVNRGGQSWKSYGRPSCTVLPLLRLIYLPEIDNQTAAIRLSVKGTDVQQSIDPGLDVQSMSLPVTGDRTQAELVIESHARGMLSIANVVQTYLPQ